VAEPVQTVAACCEVARLSTKSPGVTETHCSGQLVIWSRVERHSTVYRTVASVVGKVTNVRVKQKFGKLE